MLTFIQFINENKTFAIGPHGIGSYLHDDEEGTGGTVTQQPNNRSVVNEPFKDTSYFRRPDIKKYENTMRKAISQGKSLPPVASIAHPADPKVRVVIDGNHRFRAAQNARTKTFPHENISHDDVRLLHPDHTDYDSGEKAVQQGHPLSNFKEKDGSYDMDKPRKELGGLALKHYFTNPDGSHNFDG